MDTFAIVKGKINNFLSIQIKKFFEKRKTNTSMEVSDYIEFLKKLVYCKYIKRII